MPIHPPIHLNRVPGGTWILVGPPSSLSCSFSRPSCSVCRCCPSASTSPCARSLPLYCRLHVDEVCCLTPAPRFHGSFIRLLPWTRFTPLRWWCRTTSLFVQRLSRAPWRGTRLLSGPRLLLPRTSFMGTRLFCFPAMVLACWVRALMFHLFFLVAVCFYFLLPPSNSFGCVSMSAPLFFSWYWHLRTVRNPVLLPGTTRAATARSLGA